MRASAIIVAAGGGTRLGANGPKAFVRVAGRAMLSYSLEAIAGTSEIGEVVVAVPAGFEPQARAQVDAAKLKLPVKITPGGRERQDSVRIALELVSAEAEVVVVHDAARPFAPPELVQACIEAARREGAAIAAVPVSDTLKRVDGGAVVATVTRAGLWQAQTPQAFRRDLLVAAHRRAAEKKLSATDDADLVEQAGGKVVIVETSGVNIKVTTPADLLIAAAVAASIRKR
ncbi:MAG TPA: 2-C-methyl-D-erythritol 4-phosphate cytidylyltransferase [Candidatus Binataceae bacterium]|nr:2-C-methyl-D-erythritol 4-phosphate cytidylyltransferase [Candidatus Binataceae bacterium]